MSFPEEKKLLYKPRPFQLELFQKALKRDIIIHARTGSGKTFISLMLLNHLSSDIEKAYSKGGMRSIFLANNVPLVTQQAEFLRSQTHFQIGDYYGEKRIGNKVLDVWDLQIWENQLEDNQVLVMTPKIFENMIDHSFIELKKVNLIIFDECHHGIGKHPYSVIMKKVKDKKKDLKLRILGMTASIVNKKCSLNKFKKAMRTLEETYGCKIETSSIIFNEDQSIKEQYKPRTIIVYYENKTDFSYLKDSLEAIRNNLECYEKEIKENTKENIRKLVNDEENFFLFSTKNKNLFTSLKRECSDLENIFDDLGLWSFSIALKQFMEKLNAEDFSTFESTEKQKINLVRGDFENLLKNLSQFISETDELNCEKILEFSSDKLKKLLDIFLKNKIENHNFHSIIFVERKSIAFLIDLVLKKLAETETWSFIKSDYISSITGGKKNMSLTQQEKALRSFRKHKINVLIATSIVEEGVDVPACNMVIRFNKILNFGSFIQSKGRARSQNSSFVIMVNGNDPDLEGYEQIENDFEQNINKENTDHYIIEPNELDKLDLMIKPYVKGSCRITCTKAIDLINRYCSSLENSSCGVLYPIYYDDETIINENPVFRFSLRLPPNSVINKTIQSEFFAKKKWAKMDAALKMCIELDKAGELAENLTILSKEEWLNPHYNLNDHFKDCDLGKKVGTRKLKREYTATFADELMGNKPVPNQDSFLYRLCISEEPDLKKLNKERIFGILSSKKLPNLPTFKLYNGNSELDVSILEAEVTINLNESQYEILKKYYSSILNLLKIKADLNFDNPIYGILLVILKPEDFGIDWEYLKSMPKETNAYEYYNQYKANNLNSIKDYLWLYRKQLFSIKKIECKYSPLSKFPNEKEASNYKDYFEKKYQLKTQIDDQPLVEVKNESIRNNFFLKDNFSQKKEKKNNYKIYLIMEHMKIIPLKKNLLFNYSMIPAILYRIDCLLKARKLQLSIEGVLKKRMNLEDVQNVPLSWNKSIKFNKLNQNNEILNEENGKINEENGKINDVNGKINDVNGKINDVNEIIIDVNDSELTSDDESLEKLLDPCPKYKTQVVFCQEQDILHDRPENPNLIIKKQVDEPRFPNMFNILQCVTLKSACDSFDLERYELLGDCFLKLVVVMKIYCVFPKINEGKMVSLKSARVSNNYLYRLAAEKKLNEYIIWDNFMPQKNWVVPNFDKDLFLQNSNFNTKISDKSMADCIEALIGIYLTYLGSDAAKAFIEWLDFKISDNIGKADFTTECFLPEPMFSQSEFTLTESQINRLKNFEKILGYEFTNKYYLFQALTHPSDISNCCTSSYQKLELIGDAVLDILVTQHIFQDQKEHSPGELTDLRQALVNNKFFAHLAAKHEFHKFLSHLSKDIFDQLKIYLEDYKFYPPDVEYLGIDNPYGLKSDDYEIESPKFLADIFESVAGAIYLDSNLDLQKVWEIYFKMMNPYITAFKRNIPCSPIKALHLLKPQSKFSINITELEDNTEKNQEKIFVAELSVDGQNFEGSGRNKNIAKIIAFKKAVVKFSKTKVKFF